MDRRTPLRPARERGAVLIAVLLALMLLAGLVFYVFNLGRAAQQRVVAQASADATAHAGGAWVARSMNQVALNNIDMSRTIAMINILDSLPMAVEFTHLDQASLEQIIDSQLNRGVSDPHVRDALSEMLDTVSEDVRDLEQLDEMLNHSGFDTRVFTWYDGPNGRGECWRALEALDAANTATMETLADATQATAINAGQSNLRESPDPVALMLPARVALPYVRGEFDDFEPVLGSDEFYGGLTKRAVETADSADWYQYRGPFDTVFGWRRIHRRGGSGTARSYRGGMPLTGRGTVASPTYTPGPAVDYSVYGPQRWMVDRMSSIVSYSRFAVGQRIGSTPRWINLLAGYRLSYLWPGPSSLATVVRPEWENDYSAARALAGTDRSRIRHTRFIVTEMDSKVPRGHPQFGSQGTYSFDVRVVYVSGWLDPATWPVDRVNSWIWRDEWSYPTKNPTNFRIDHVIFAGIDKGEEELEVTNPHNFASRADLPAPTDFDYAQVPIDDQTRRDYFTYLGVVRQDGRGRLWSRRFDGEDGFSRVALAQVRVFNNHSWDMWTPMWQAQLEPIDGYDDWVAQYERDVSDLATEPDLTGAPLGELGDYLASLKPLVDALGLEH